MGVGPARAHRQRGACAPVDAPGRASAALAALSCAPHCFGQQSGASLSRMRRVTTRPCGAWGGGQGRYSRSQGGPRPALPFRPPGHIASAFEPTRGEGRRSALPSAIRITSHPEGAQASPASRRPRQRQQGACGGKGLSMCVKSYQPIDFGTRADDSPAPSAIGERRGHRPALPYVASVGHTPSGWCLWTNHPKKAQTHAAHAPQRSSSPKAEAVGV